MGRRDYLYTKKCGHDGCNEYERFVFSTLREFDEHAKWRTKDKPYLCARHKNPDEVLTLANHTRVVSYVVKADPHGVKRWHGPGPALTSLGGGFEQYQAYAEDFDPGTQVQITINLWRVCQVAGRLDEACCGEPAGDGGWSDCEEVGPHTRHRVGEHTIYHSLKGNGYSCEAIDRYIQSRKEQERDRVRVPGDDGTADGVLPQ